LQLARIAANKGFGNAPAIGQHILAIGAATGQGWLVAAVQFELAV
jgi:hypothetical protein